MCNVCKTTADWMEKKKLKEDKSNIISLLGVLVNIPACYTSAPQLIRKIFPVKEFLEACRILWDILKTIWLHEQYCASVLNDYWHCQHPKSLQPGTLFQPLQKSLCILAVKYRHMHHKKQCKSCVLEMRRIKAGRATARMNYTTGRA